MLKVISYNVRGITTVMKQLLLRKWLETNPNDVLLLQELHMTTQLQLESFKRSFPDYSIICSLGTWSAGGVMIMIKIKLLIVDAGTDHCGRVAFVKVVVNNCPIIIANIYAPTQANERCVFFENLHLYIPSSHWILVGGDFNCVPEPAKDRLQQGARVDRRSYSFLNSHVLQPLSLVELFRSKYPHSVVYSFHNDVNNIHSRIDFFLGTNLVRRNRQHIAYIPIGLSDHDGVSITLCLPPSTISKFHRWICNTEVIKKPSFLSRFQKIWDILLQSSDFNGLDWWSDLKTSLTLLLQDEQKQMVVEARRKMKELQEHYRTVATNPSNDDLIEMATIRNNIHHLLIEKAAANIHGYRERNAQTLGEIAKSRLSSTRSNQSLIHFLNHPSKGRVDTIDEMLDVATNYYEDLYREKPIDVSLWSSLFDGLPKLGVQDRALLDCEITVKECLDALRSMPDGKTPGDDGIPTETWRVVFPLIGSQYVKMLNIAKEKGRFKPDFLRALLTLLKKKNKFDGQMKDFRPLSLMNIDYKILSKVLSTRLRKVLGNIIHQDQTCSIPGRAIHDNIYLIRSIIDYQQRIRDPIGLILWDQEKAFDRVNHRYLVGVLEAFGFGSEFISWVKLLYANGSFRIKINNSISIPISFNSGVRQGCSLSGGLFIISLEPLLHRIRSNQAIPGILPPGGQYSNIRQVVLANKNNINPDHVRIKTIAYADDVNTLVRNKDEETATIAITKTEILWVSDWLPPPCFESKVNCDWCTFLGIPINTTGQLPKSELERKISNIKQQIGYWSQINLSLTERVTVLKVFILSQLIYWLSLSTVPKESIMELQKLILHFFWLPLGPRINFRTIIGHKYNGGFSVPHIDVMISSLRIKCGLQLLNLSRPAPWKFFVLIDTAVQLRQYAPWVWFNLTPHRESGNTFFHEVASHTAQWLKAGGKLTSQNNEPSIYWQLINRQYFRRPICEVRNPHLKDISFFRLLRESLPNRQLDFWLLLANFGIHTRSRLGHNDISRQCLLCPAVETPAHLFINCPILVGLFDILNNRIQSICGHKLNKAIMDVVYLKEILQMSPNRLTRRNMVFLIGCYLHTIWTFRNVVRHQCHQHQGLDPCIAARQFLAATKHLPFDNG
ncbi:unnamed protein product [Rotaria socialis]|uniref:Reverse transcriptase domain-containing protein n=3 Tax=Rotaria socialis TaxID=392032 RepID=A0A817X7G8_9BILA|nr:unnamed protein product [Rotaria socialis]